MKDKNKYVTDELQMIKEILNNNREVALRQGIKMNQFEQNLTEAMELLAEEVNKCYYLAYSADADIQEIKNTIE